MNILDVIDSIELITKPQNISECSIQNAEKELHLSFSNDYREYIKHYGTITFYGHEITGISKARYKNVVAVTLQEREFCFCVDDNWYVIERTNIDDIVIWQSSSGEIFQTKPNSKPIKIFDSLVDYILFLVSD